MEDLPGFFDLWTTVPADRGEVAKQLLARANPELSRIEILRRVVRSRGTAVPMMLAEGRRWDETVALRALTIAHLGGASVFCMGYGPTDVPRLRYCASCDLHYGGIIGCLVCRQ